MKAKAKAKAEEVRMVRLRSPTMEARTRKLKVNTHYCLLSIVYCLLSTVYCLLCPVLKKVDSFKLINHEIKKLLCTVQ